MRYPWSNIFNRELIVLVYLCFWVDFLLNDAMFCTMFLKNIAPDVFDDVL